MVDGGYGLVLVLVRGVHVIGSAPAMRRWLRVGWRALRVAVIVTLLICAALGAGLL